LADQSFQILRQTISVIQKNRRSIIQFHDRDLGAVDGDLCGLLQRDEVTSRNGDRSPHPADDRPDDSE
jgi:hypothetical protein